MRRRGWLCLGLVAALTGVSPAALAQAPQADPALRASCRRLVTAQAGGMDFGAVILTMSQRFLPALTPERRSALQAAFARHSDELTEVAAGVCASSLTADDVAALTDFYGTPLGQSIARKALSGDPLTPEEHEARARFEASPAGAAVKAKQARIIVQTVQAEQPIYRKAMAELCAESGQCPAGPQTPAPGAEPAPAH
ncbi:MAG TPA: DUF2059 domain-containing protein [Phenylobacterium sp.]|uniref:DUF2059 domain-containing protein n=1 Tax=Phenylobacterium sp. TaxID=1871053 RepID=UPI002BD8D2CE|nr:DUF2059 domain-containing protein [Phenylobacterium sp.]HSV03848.1 DUF2059 domain-containing protein [Phenylobacterium sp.]